MAVRLGGWGATTLHSTCYWGTGRPIPHSEIVRGTGDGAVLYTDLTLAIDADTGKIVWYHQFLPRDNWNFDHAFEQMLVDIEVTLPAANVAGDWKARDYMGH